MGPLIAAGRGALLVAGVILWRGWDAGSRMPRCPGRGRYGWWPAGGPWVRDAGCGWSSAWAPVS